MYLFAVGSISHSLILYRLNDNKSPHSYRQTYENGPFSTQLFQYQCQIYFFLELDSMERGFKCQKKLYIYHERSDIDKLNYARHD